MENNKGALSLYIVTATPPKKTKADEDCLDIILSGIASDREGAINVIAAYRTSAEEKIKDAKDAEWEKKCAGLVEALDSIGTMETQSSGLMTFVVSEVMKDLAANALAAYKQSMKENK